MSSNTLLKTNLHRDIVAYRNSPGFEFPESTPETNGKIVMASVSVWIGTANGPVKLEFPLNPSKVSSEGISAKSIHALIASSVIE